MRPEADCLFPLDQAEGSAEPCWFCSDVLAGFSLCGSWAGGGDATREQICTVGSGALPGNGDS